MKVVEGTAKKLKCRPKIYHQCVFKTFLGEEAMYELKKTKEIGQTINRDDLTYKTGNKKKDKTYDFDRIKTMRCFGREI